VRKKKCEESRRKAAPPSCYILEPIVGIVFIPYVYRIRQMLLLHPNSIFFWGGGHPATWFACKRGPSPPKWMLCGGIPPPSCTRSNVHAFAPKRAAAAALRTRNASQSSS